MTNHRSSSDVVGEASVVRHDVPLAFAQNHRRSIGALHSNAVPEDDVALLKNTKKYFNCLFHSLN